MGNFRSEAWRVGLRLTRSSTVNPEVPYTENFAKPSELTLTQERMPFNHTVGSSTTQHAQLATVARRPLHGSSILIPVMDVSTPSDFVRCLS